MEDIFSPWFANGDISILDKLDKNLLAKILSQLTRKDLSFACQTSKRIHQVCKEFYLKERFDAGRLYRFGRFNDEIRATPYQIPDLHDIVSVSCGMMGDDMAFVTRDGDLTIYGRFSYVEAPPVSSVSIGMGHIAMISKTGELETSNRTFKFDSPVIHVSCGRNHTALVTQNGHLYTFGDGYEGQLGNLSRQDEPNPYRVTAIDEPVVHVACGEYRTAVVTANGHVYIFGDNLLTPYKIPQVDSAVFVACGPEEIAFITVKGELYTMGTQVPKRVTGIPEPVSHISYGLVHSAILAGKGKLYMLGNGLYGKLGDGDRYIHFASTPQLVEGIPQVVSVSCGPTYTALVTASAQEMGYQTISVNATHFDPVTGQMYDTPLDTTMQ